MHIFLGNGTKKGMVYYCNEDILRFAAVFSEMSFLMKRLLFRFQHTSINYFALLKGF